MNKDKAIILEHYQQIKENIARFSKDYGRTPPDLMPDLMVVTKTIDAESIRVLLEAGHRLFGENRVQEAMEKYPALRNDYPDLELHLIGPLQSNKLNQAITLFDGIQTLDRASLFDKMMALDPSKAKALKSLYIQVNIGCEDQKAGIALDEADDFIEQVKQSGLPLSGLMCIPPQGFAAAPYFALLQQIARKHQLPCLSMGMSGDYEFAIAQGATLIRIGSALFGARTP